MTDWTVAVKYVNYSKRCDLADHLTPDTSGISTDSGGGSRIHQVWTYIRLAFQAQTQVLFDFLIDARGDLDGQCFSRKLLSL